MSDLRLRAEHISDLAFDQLLGDSAEPGDGARVQAHLAGCVRCARRYEALADLRAGFLERVPSWERLNAQQTAANRSGGRRRWLWSSAAAVGAGLVLLLSLSLARRDTLPGLRSKGGPRISAYVKHGERVARADSGSTVLPGDYVRFTYSTDRPVHFALLNRDALRAATYYPLGAETVRVAAGHEVALDFSIKLDAQPGTERTFGLFCEAPEQLEPLRAALQATGRLPDLPHCRIDVLTLEKQAP